MNSDLKELVVVLSLIVSLGEVMAQQYNYQWPFGYGDDFSIDFGFSMLDFRKDQVTVFPYAEVQGFTLGNFGSFICDRQGSLILMTNNCKVVDVNFQTIENGDTLTPGRGYEFTCPFDYYAQDQGTLFLPDLVSDSIYYLVHKESQPYDELREIASKALYISTIVKRSDQSFYLKDKQILFDEFMNWGRLTGTPHADKQSWWFSVTAYNDNQLLTWNVGQEVVTGPLHQNIGPALIDKELNSGQMSFVGNGQLLGINNERYGLMLYDFDPVTGMYSNYRNLHYPEDSTAEGLCFSASGRFAYVSTAHYLSQIDLEEQDSAVAVTNLGYVRTADDTGWPVGLGSMYLGPDCRVYIGPGTATYYMHVIHQPEVKGTACMFEERAIRTPGRLDFELPNLPNYHPLSPCDPGISWGILTSTTTAPTPGILDEPEVFPNPANRYTTFRFSADLPSKSILQLTDATGRVVKSVTLPYGEQVYRLSLQEIPAGIYFYQVIEQDELRYKGKLLVQK